MKGRFLLLIGVAASALSFAGASPAVPDRIVVDNDGVQCPNPDSSTIQGGVDLASPGDTVFVCAGTYLEDVLITGPAKNNIRVVGADVDDVIVDGTNTLENGFRLENVSGVELRRFTVTRFHDDVWLENADGNRIRDNRTSFASGHDGIVMANDSDGNVVERNVSFNNTQAISCGISAGGGSGDNLIRNNVTFGNPNTGILLGGGILGPAGPGNRIIDNVSRNNPGQGILLADSRSALVAHNLVHDNGQHGILVTGALSSGVRIEHNRVLHNGSTNDNDGIRLQNGASNNIVSHNESRLNRHDGVHLTATTGMPGASGNVVKHNRLVENGTPLIGNGCGVDVENGSSNNVVRDNYIVGHARAGVRVRTAGNANVVADNDIRDSGADGIRNESTPGTLIEDNHVRGGVGFGTVLGHGIHVLTSSGVNVVENESDRNMADGLLLENGDSGIVEDNDADRNGRDGIRADANSAGNTIVDNEMAKNAEHDCHDDSVGGGTAGTANFWIDNEGETENRPGLCDDGKDHDDDE